jgi:hypothetical protein
MSLAVTANGCNCPLVAVISRDIDGKLITRFKASLTETPERVPRSPHIDTDLETLFVFHRNHLESIYLLSQRSTSHPGEDSMQTPGYFVSQMSLYRPCKKPVAISQGSAIDPIDHKFAPWRGHFQSVSRWATTDIQHHRKKKQCKIPNLVVEEARFAIEARHCLLKFNCHFM